MFCYDSVLLIAFSAPSAVSLYPLPGCLFYFLFFFLYNLSCIFILSFLFILFSTHIWYFISLWLCCYHPLAWWLTHHFTQKIITKGKHEEKLECSGGIQEKIIYLPHIDSPGLSDARAKGKRKAFIKVSNGKTFLSPPVHSLSARINAPKSPKARSSYMLAVIQPASFV